MSASTVVLWILTLGASFMGIIPLMLIGVILTGMSIFEIGPFKPSSR